MTAFSCSNLRMEVENYFLRLGVVEGHPWMRLVNFFLYESLPDSPEKTPDFAVHGNSSYRESIRSLVYEIKLYMRGEVGEELKGKLQLLEGEWPYKNEKIFISGFGRSGTGAVKDWLKECEGTVLAPGSELQIITGEYGLKNFYSDGLSFYDFFPRYLSLFFVHALGVGLENSYSKKNELRKSRLVISLENKKIVEPFFFIFLACMHRFNQSEENLLSSVGLFFDAYSDMFLDGASNIVVYNNLANASYLKFLTALHDYKCLAVRRDPRSQYASYKTTRGKGLSASFFCKRYLKVLDDYESFIDKVDDECKKNFLEIVFEDFVVYEKYRREISGALGLSNNSEYSVFKPWESFHNCYLHKLEDVDSDDIDLLSKKLKRHLNL